MKINLNIKYTALIACCIAAYMLVYSCDKGVIPDLFGFSNYLNQDVTGYFKSIYEITFSSFGVLVAVIILGVQMIGDSSLRVNRVNLLESNFVIIFNTLALTLTTSSLISSILIHDFHSVGNISIAYFVLILFLIYLFSLIYLVYWIIQKSNPLKSIRKQIFNTKLVREEFDKLITNELIISIRKRDKNAYENLILKELVKKTISDLESDKSRALYPKTLKRIISVWKSGNIDATREGENWYFNEVWEGVREIYEYASNTKSDYRDYNELEFFTWEQIEYLKETKNVDGLLFAAQRFGEIFWYSLKNNCPNQHKISDLIWQYQDSDKVIEIPENADTNEEIKWDKILEFLNTLGSVMNASIDLKSIFLLKRVSFVNDQFIFNRLYVREFSLGDWQENYIIWQIYSLKNHYQLKAIETGLINELQKYYPFNNRDLISFCK